MYLTIQTVSTDRRSGAFRERDIPAMDVKQNMPRPQKKLRHDSLHRRPALAEFLFLLLGPVGPDLFGENQRLRDRPS